jgi:hypothetical protein
MNSCKIPYSFRIIVIPIILFILVSVSFYTAAAESTGETKLTVERRGDGLTIVRKPDQEKQTLHYMTLIIKTGYAHDPMGKFGITNLTNELVYHLLRDTSAININYQTYADYSAFHFITTRTDFNNLCVQLDRALRSDALLLYDLCNALVGYHLSQPKPPELAAVSRFYSLIYGADHPYNSIFAPNYNQLNITEINKWFRQIYKPNNFIIASSHKLPDDFLRRPAGRDLKETVTLNEVPDSSGVPNPELKCVPVRDNIATVCLGFETPKLGEEGVFAVFLVEKYLNRRLWKVIREDHGLSYDPEVFNLLISKSYVPSLQVILHTLAPDAGKVIKMIIAELKKIAAEGIPETEIARIVGGERRRRELIGKDLQATMEFGALYGLVGEEWLVNQDNYFSLLHEEVQLIPQVITAGLNRIKIVVAGPEETGGYLEGIAKEIEELAQL